MTFPRSLELLDDFPVTQDLPFRISRNRIKHFYPAHRHDYVEISLVLEGEGSETINGIEHPMIPGTVTFLLPYQVHEIRAHTDRPLKLYNCMFAPEFLLSTAGGHPELQQMLFDRRIDEPGYLQLEPAEFEVLHRAMSDMVAEFQSSHPWRKTMLQAKLTETLIRFDRLATDRSGSTASRDSVLGSTPMSAEGSDLLLYVHRHYREPLTLKTIAAEFHRNETYLCEQFRQQFGKTFVQLLQEIRTRHAAALLVSTNLKLADIAAEAGFGSTASLFRVFRQQRGMSPDAFRQLRKEGTVPTYDLWGSEHSGFSF